MSHILCNPLLIMTDYFLPHLSPRFLILVLLFVMAKITGIFRLDVLARLTGGK